MTKKNNIALLALLATSLVSTNVNAETTWSASAIDTAKSIVQSKYFIAPVLFGVFRLMYKTPVKDYKSRFLWEDVKAHCKQLKDAMIGGNLTEAVRIIKELAKNGWYLVDDEIVGQVSENNLVKVKDKKLYVSEKKSSYGCLGTAYDYLDVLDESKKVLMLVAGMCLFLNSDAKSCKTWWNKSKSFTVSFGE